MGVPHPSWLGVPPSQVRLGVTSIVGQDRVYLHPRSGQGGTPILGQDWWYPYPRSRQGGTPPQIRSQGRAGVPPTGTAQYVLATRRAVCLLRSHRRTFLSYYWKWDCICRIVSCDYWEHIYYNVKDKCTQSRKSVQKPTHPGVKANTLQSPKLGPS